MKIENDFNFDKKSDIGKVHPHMFTAESWE
jgi:hypothetical protein